jgi:hypothetical protein
MPWVMTSDDGLTTRRATLGSLRGHRHSKALTVPYSADNRTETSPEASSAPLPCREMSRMRGVEVYPGITLAAAIEGREVGAEVLRLQARER